MDNKGFLSVNLKDISTGDNENEIKIEGYANVAFGDYGELIADRDDETIIPSGIELDNYKKNPVMLYSHDRALIVGKITTINIDTRGLYIAGVVYKDISPSVFAMVKTGSLRAMSIGFRGKDARYDEVNDIFIYTKTELYEISLVSVPAQPDSIFEVVKDASGSLCFAKHCNNTNHKTKGNNMNEFEKALASFKVDLLKSLKDELNKEPEVVTLSDAEKEALIQEELKKDKYKVGQKDVLTLLKEVTLDESNIESYIEALNGLSAKINSKLTELIGE